ncbi:methyltransferase domain-containing protein [Saccharopolyspora sp. ASAGF58]|uniref:methyltransferase domain-containing protein n=1 Tax=Saccharopolyspora sp. ASAGF58 TaxID=2719023 RepID=UPI0014400487|nr:methyltransferase domain-containing protein [Saccharopolyspora sp. ASAGF58]QIZ34671.1 protein-L-isoaspartate(D-aspartate) O-methyltransferase [Saccharopolyspora sp. ASAGF58]
MTAWRERLGVPRDRFIPPEVWVDDPVTGGFVSVSRKTDGARWRELVEADEPIITQVDDGKTRPGAVGFQPSSSCSKPSLVADMLDALQVEDGHRVLEIGTGTGWNAANLRERVGDDGQVTSLEVDLELAEQAVRALIGAGCAVVVVTADGTKGYPDRAPYDRLIATASVRRVPRAWIEQAVPGGVIVTPWGTDYCNGTLLRLTVPGDGSAWGRCGKNLRFMRVRDQRREFLGPSDAEISGAEKGTTLRSARELFEMTEFSHAAFTIGLRVPSCYLTIEDIDADHRHIELHDVRSASWARVIMARGADFEVYQLGPRRLWDEADAAYARWLESGLPTPDRYGLTITVDGTHEVWLDEPTSEHRWAVEL